MSQQQLDQLLAEVRACRVCADALGFTPRPVVRASTSARLLIIGQAPGSRVHASGVPWDDASGDRLRSWTGLDKSIFYDESLVAIMPMGLCYPGKGTSGDLPPRPECAPLWHARLRGLMPGIKLTLLVGSYAQNANLPGARGQSMTETIRQWRDFLPTLFPLPHPSWRSTLWLRQQPWFEADVLPVLKSEVAQAIARAS